MTEESEDGLPGPFPAAAVPRRLGGSEAAALAPAGPLSLPLARARAGEPRTAVGPMAVAPMTGMTGVARVTAMAAMAATTARSHPLPRWVAAATTAELVARVVAAPARLTDGEVGWPSLVFLTFNARQGGAYQLTMHGPIF